MAIRAKTHRLHYAHLALGYYSLGQAEWGRGSFQKEGAVVRQAQMGVDLEEAVEGNPKALGLVLEEGQEVEEARIPCSLEVDMVENHGTGRRQGCRTYPGHREVLPELGDTEGNRRRRMQWEVIEIELHNGHRASHEHHGHLVHRRILKRKIG